MLLLDTALDSVGIVRIPDGWWDRSGARLDSRPTTDMTRRSSSREGPARCTTVRIRATSRRPRFTGPVTLVLPAGTWHSVTMDADVAADATAFFTVSGTVIAPFSVQMEIVTRGRIPFPASRWSTRLPVEATLWSAPGSVRGSRHRGHHSQRGADRHRGPRACRDGSSRTHPLETASRCRSTPARTACSSWPARPTPPHRSRPRFRRTDPPRSARRRGRSPPPRRRRVHLPQGRRRLHPERADARGDHADAVPRAVPARDAGRVPSTGSSRPRRTRSAAGS